MEGVRITFCLFIVVVSCNANLQPKTKEVRTTALSDKIIGGVIDLVHSHKNKPSSQQNVQQTYPNQGYNQYPGYQWNGQSTNYQGQGFNYQGQYQNQGQYGNYQNGYTQTTYPQNVGNYGSGQTYPPPPPAGFSNGQAQSQGQYQIIYQNPPSNPPQYTQTTGQYNNQQSNQQFQQNQGTGAFQGTQTTGIYQGQNPSGSYQNQQGNFQGQTGSFQTQGVAGSESGHNQGFQTSGSHQTSNSPGPTCVCQAWTKPNEVLNDPAADKIEKIGNEPAI